MCSDTVPRVFGDETHIGIGGLSREMALPKSGPSKPSPSGRHETDTEQTRLRCILAVFVRNATILLLTEVGQQFISLQKYVSSLTTSGACQ